MGLFVLGVNHKECPVAVREKLHFNHTKLHSALQLSQEDESLGEALILSTCNRVEIYGYTDDEALPEEQILALIEKTHDVQAYEFRDYLYRFEGKEAVRHLFRVASGLDSMIIGENEILGQLRDAFFQANQVQTVHSLLYKLMERALKTGKEVRSKTKINQGAVSIPSAAVELSQKIFGKMSGEKVMVLGTGEMSRLTLKSLKGCGANILYVVSRHKEKGDALAKEFDAERLSVHDWNPYLKHVDILITSTASPKPIVHYDQIKEALNQRRHRPLFIIDIAVPRDVEPHVNTLDDVYLYNVDDLKSIAASNLRQRRQDIDAAEVLVEEAVSQYQGWVERLKARPTLERFESFVDQVIERELERLTQQGALSEDQKRQTRHRIRQKLLHPPLEKIKEASQNGGVTRYLEALHSLFDLEKDRD